MSLLDDVSIVVTPNGYKAGELYAVIPSSGAADMDVTRATAATRVDENGLVNYAEIVGSELAICGDFECASPLTGWTDNAPIGEISIDSGRLKVLNLTNRGRSYRTYTGLTIGKTYEAFVGNTSGNVTGFCHITSGTANNNITLNAPFFFVAGATTAEFQCGVNSTVVDRFTFFDNISLIENARDNVPRIDYTGGGCPHILAEPQRTNLFLQSEDFTSEWSTSDATITANSTISPDGTQNASTLTTTASGGTVQESLSISDGDIAFSLFVKKGSTDGVRLRIDASTDFNGYFDLTDGTIHSATGNAKIEPLDNDWYKISVAASVTSFVKASIYTTDGTTSYDNGTVFIWGAQLEEGSYATSYIPTSGSTVTRNQDIFTRDGIGSLINSTEGVLFVEMAALADDGTTRVITLNDGSANNSVRLYYFSTSNAIALVLRKGGVSVVSDSYVLSDILTFNKFAVKWKENDVALWVNGSEVDTENSFSTFSADTLNKLSFSRGNDTNYFYGKVKQLQVYKTALTDAQLTSLTS